MLQPLSIEAMVRKIALRLGVRVTSAPIGSTDMQIQQLVEIFNEEVYELGTLYRWQDLMNETHFVSVATEDQGVFYGTGGILPPDTQFNYIVSDTMWDRTARQPVRGPKSSLDWQARKALHYTSGPFPTYRLRGNHLFMLPIPAAGHDIYFEYASKDFVHNPNDDTYGTTFTSNESTPELDCDIVMAGVRWRWKLLKGFPYAEEKRIWEQVALNASGRDGGSEALSLGGGNSVMGGARGGDWSTRPV